MQSEIDNREANRLIDEWQIRTQIKEFIIDREFIDMVNKNFRDLV